MLSLVPLHFCWRAYYLLDNTKHYLLTDIILFYFLSIISRIKTRKAYRRMIADTKWVVFDIDQFTMFVHSVYISMMVCIHVIYAVKLSVGILEHWYIGIRNKGIYFWKYWGIRYWVSKVWVLGFWGTVVSSFSLTLFIDAVIREWVNHAIV